MSTQNTRIRRALVAAGAVIGTVSATVLFAAPAQAAPTVTRDGGDLVIRGDADANRITVGRTLAGTITLNGQPVLGGTATTDNVVHVLVDAAGGNDIVSLDERNGEMPKGELVGGDGNDQLTGGSGDDTLVGGSGADWLLGGAGADLLQGDAGNDGIVGGTGDDTAFLGTDNDQFFWNPGDGDDKVDGDAGSDTLRFNGSDGVDGIDAFPLSGTRAMIRRNTGDASPTRTVDFDGIEQVYVNTFGGADVASFQDMTGTGLRLIGITLAPATGPDTGADDVSLILSERADRAVIGGSPATGITVSGPATTVRMVGAENLRVSGFFGNDTIDASRLVAGTTNLTEDGDLGSLGSSNDTLIGSPGNDQLFGGGGDDRLEGRGGTDVLDGGTGNNVIIP